VSNNNYMVLINWFDVPCHYLVFFFFFKKKIKIFEGNRIKFGLKKTHVHATSWKLVPFEQYGVKRIPSISNEKLVIYF
jgi:hypothetical protein